PDRERRDEPGIRVRQGYRQHAADVQEAWVTISLSKRLSIFYDHYLSKVDAWCIMLKIAYMLKTVSTKKLSFCA
ncbi:hypothetical protein, partial [Klebsiella pneumoniae]|uniref:hypothetical protein n=1 Tax=Klebsiella pneumoniae TaxID=573 RepID=UPI003B52C1E1